jgi:hypothetical protein
MGGILHLIRSAIATNSIIPAAIAEFWTTINTANIIYSTANVGTQAAIVSVFVNGAQVAKFAGATEIPNPYKANSYNQIRFGSSSRYAQGYLDPGAWDGQISEVRITQGKVYPNSVLSFTANSSFTPPSVAFGLSPNTLALFKATNGNTWTEVVNGISLTTSGVYSITSNYPPPINGVNYSLDIRNRSNTSPGLVINGPSFWGNWPITIEWWARSSSAVDGASMLIFKTSNVYSDSSGNGTVFYSAYSDPTNANTSYQGIGRFLSGTNSVKLQANVWYHYAFYIEK